MYAIEHVYKDMHLYYDTLNVIRDVLEDHHILKIFHDCRMDSLALHVVWGICPKNVHDMAGCYLF